jgi:hypothetical protein
VKPRIGRPPKPPGEARTHDVRVPVNAAERAQLEQWAAAAGAPLATLVRRTVLRASKR